MTPPIDDSEALRRILSHTDALLLDFDGPICSVFSGFPAPIVAQQLRDILAQGGHTNLPHEIATATDPFDVLFYAATLGPDEARYVEAAFTAHEVEAIHTAQPTPGAHNLIHAWTATGRGLAIVSNNSQHAVQAYLDLHDLRASVDHIAARRTSDTSRLKPDSYLVTEVINVLMVRPDRCVLVGDSLTDMQAAVAAGVPAIAYANKAQKLRQLATTGCDTLVTGIGLLLEVVAAHDAR